MPMAVPQPSAAAKVALRPSDAQAQAGPTVLLSSRPL